MRRRMNGLRRLRRGGELRRRRARKRGGGKLPGRGSAHASGEKVHGELLEKNDALPTLMQG